MTFTVNKKIISMLISTLNTIFFSKSIQNMHKTFFKDIETRSPLVLQSALVPHSKVGAKPKPQMAFTVSKNKFRYSFRPQSPDFRTGSLTAPDATFCHSSLNAQIKWKIGETMGSDHLPILVTIPTQRWNETKRSKRFIYKKADWAKFRDEVLKQVEEVDWTVLKVNDAQKAFCLCLLAAAHKAIPRGSRPNAKIWWDDELDEMKTARKEAREKAGESDEATEEWTTKRTDMRHTALNKKR